MSQGNVDFVLKHNDFISKDKVEILPNAITPLELEKLSNEYINDIKKSITYQQIKLYLFMVET